ncbi:MAG: hypothetical protein ABR587_11015 [Candidatus Binatia bacterium]
MVHRFVMSIGLVALAVGAAPATAFADVDLSGDWVYECDRRDTLGYEANVPVPVTMIQSGGLLEWTGDVTGTIDASSGEFHVDGPPAGIFVLAPSWHGTASPDGNRIDGTCNDHVFTLAVSYPMRGIRSGTAVCGDLERDPGEGCDHGPANGNNGCCNADCSLVDPDADFVCSDVDNCPDDFNPHHERVCDGVDPFEISKMRVNQNRQRIRVSAVLHGIGAALLSAVENLRILATPFDHEVSDLECVRAKARRLDCTAADGTASVRIRTSVTGGTKLIARLDAVAGLAALSAPLDVSFRDQFGIVRSATVTQCRGCLTP